MLHHVASHDVSDASRSNALAPAHITLIEDDEDVRSSVEELLCHAGHHVTAYARADDALLDLDEREAPDLILLDLMMPGMSGWQFRIEQKKRPKLRDTPVIVLSADSSSYARAMDADAHVPKPIDPSELNLVLDRVLLESERRRLLTKSMELERISALGMLVASVAHEINNPLTYLSGSLELAASDTQKLHELGGEAARLAASLSQSLADAADGSARIASVVRLLSTFSRADGTEAVEVDVVRAVQAASRIARHQIPASATFREELTSVPPVSGNEGRLAQVVLNLLVNAAQAVSLSATPQGQICVATGFDNGIVSIDVSDTGPGIEHDRLEQVFEPFFTTKPAGEGTGLGLTISRDIVSGMGGTLTVRSVLGRGATFTVSLPVARNHEQNQKRTDVPTEASGTPGTVRRILVVDDEPMILRLLQHLLSPDLVDVTDSPHEALERAAASSYDLVLSDFYMPEMSGLDFYWELVKLRPELRSAFVLMTGFHNNAEVDAFVRATRVRLLTKPFSMEAVRDSLGLATLEN